MAIAKPANRLSEAEVVTVEVAATDSARINMAGRHPVGIYTPAGAEGASVTFDVAHEIGGTLYDLFDNTPADYTVAIAAGEYRQIDPQLFRGAVEMMMSVNVAQAGADAEFVIMFAEPDKNF